MQIYEYRGVEGLVYAPVTQDDSEGYSTGTVKPLAGVAEIAKSTDSTNEAHFYDNVPAVIVSSTGSDELTITASAIPLDTLADITGQGYDATTGTFIEEERTPRYFAIGYQTKDTSGRKYYVWRLKGSFNIPDQTNTTENDGTDANGQEITFTGISTTYRFSSTGKSAKAVTVNTDLDLADVTNFWTAVQTPDTIVAKNPTPEVVIDHSNVEVNEGAKIQLSARTKPANQTVTWSSSDTTKATVDTTGRVTGVDAGSATITASITVDGTTVTDKCNVTVVEVQA